ncbi:hypothetical protein G6F56_013271 [Rhizopus delemar]|nr:hypothetical protein G6F56_013271 [Rhizopus delemar]
MRTTAVVAVILAMAPLAGIRAESLQADDRAYFADAAAEQRARDALEKQLEALQHAAGIAPAQRFQQAEAMQAQPWWNAAANTWRPPAAWTSPTGGSC